MKLLCRIIPHAPHGGKPVWNDGFFFAACRRCGTDIVRSAIESRWKPVPRGYRVAWRDRTADDVRW